MSKAADEHDLNLLPSSLDDLSGVALMSVAEEHLFAQNGKPLALEKALELLGKAQAKGDENAAWLITVLRTHSADEENIRGIFEEQVKQSDAKYHAVALYYLAGISYKEDGLDDENVSLYEQSAELGYVPALAEMAYCYDLGQGKEQDIMKALQLYRQCGSFPAALYNLAEWYEQNGDLLKQVEGKEYGEEVVTDFFFQSAVAGDPDGFLDYCIQLQEKDEVKYRIA